MHEPRLPPESEGGQAAWRRFVHALWEHGDLTNQIDRHILSERQEFPTTARGVRTANAVGGCNHNIPHIWAVVVIDC